jgi:hypothetical protein
MAGTMLEVPPKVGRQSWWEILKNNLVTAISIFSLASVPLAYALANAYVKNYAGYYRIPREFVTVELGTLITPFLFVALIAATFIIIYLGFLGFRSDVIGFRWFMLWILIYITLLLALAVPSSSLRLLVVLLAYVLLFYVTPVLIKGPVGAVREAKAALIRSLKSDRIPLWARRHLINPVHSFKAPTPAAINKVGQRLGAILFLLIAFVAALYGSASLGEYEARMEEDYSLLDFNSSSKTATAIVAVYGDKVFLANVDMQKKTIVGDVRMKRMDDLDDVRVTIREIGPLAMPK